jgi:hypothetical protein
MKRILYASVFALLVTMTSVAFAQDLGAFARQQRQEKRPSAKKVYTNDDIASQPLPNEPTAPTAAATTAADATAAKPKTPSPEDKDKATGALQAKVNAQKAEIASLTRELDVADRENRLRIANYYADAGNSLRDPKKFQDEQKAKEDEIAGKKKAIEDAKAKLADLIEEGRKAGLKVE